MPEARGGYPGPNQVGEESRIRQEGALRERRECGCWAAVWRPRNAERSLVTPILFASVFNAILVFIVRKSRVLWGTSTIRVRRAISAVNPGRIRRAVLAFASNAAQICQRHFIIAINSIYSIKDGFEEERPEESVN